jgi:hypothetical protein
VLGVVVVRRRRRDVHAHRRGSAERGAAGHRCR